MAKKWPKLNYQCQRTVETRKQDQKTKLIKSNRRFNQKLKQISKCSVEFTAKNAYLLTLTVEKESAHKSVKCKQIALIK